MYRDDIKIFDKNEKELKTMIEIIRIYSSNIGIEFGTKKWAMMIMKSGKRETEEGIELLNEECIRMLGEKEMTCIWEYLKQPPSNKQKSKKKAHLRG